MRNVISKCQLNSEQIVVVPKKGMTDMRMTELCVRLGESDPTYCPWNGNYRDLEAIGARRQRPVTPIKGYGNLR